MPEPDKAEIKCALCNGHGLVRRVGWKYLFWSPGPARCPEGCPVSPAGMAEMARLGVADLPAADPEAHPEAVERVALALMGRDA